MIIGIETIQKAAVFPAVDENESLCTIVPGASAWHSVYFYGKIICSLSRIKVDEKAKTKNR